MLFYSLLYYISCSPSRLDTAIDILKRPDDWSVQDDSSTEQFDTEVDKDGDGQPSIEDGGDDCDDWDPNSYFGAYEIEDGKDNDCDGYKDWDGIFDDGSVMIHSQAIFEGNFYDFEPHEQPPNHLKSHLFKLYPTPKVRQALSWVLISARPHSGFIL